MHEDKTFRARLEKIDDGMYRAFYRQTTPREEQEDEAGAKGRIPPDTHVGSDAASVRAFVESLAKNRGFEKVVWEP
jgi:hypothetical protein